MPDTSKSFRWRFVYHLLWSSLLFLLCKFLIGNFYEVYEAIPPATLTGLLMDGTPANIIYPIASIGLSDLYVKLYGLVPSVAWYDYFMATYFILAAAVVFSAVQKVLQGRLKMQYILLLNTTLFILFFADHILNWNYTRTSVVVCSSAFIWLTLVWLDEEFTKRSLLPLFFNTLLFTLGVLIRPESGELIFIIGAFFILCYAGISKQSIAAVFSLLIPVFVIAGAIWYDRHTSEEFYMQLEPVMEYQIALGNVLPLSDMKTPEDSMKYLALKEGMVNDPEKISFEFVKRVSAGKSIFRLEEELFARASRIFQENILAYLHLIFFNLFFGITAVYFLFRDRLLWWRYLLFQLFFWSLVFFICYIMIMEQRIFGPLLFFYSSAHLIFLFKAGYFEQAKKPLFKGSLLMALCVSVLFQLVLMKNGRSDYEESMMANQPVYHALENAAKGKMLIPDASAFMVIFFNNFTPFQNPDFSAFKQLFLTDFEAVSLTPPYRKFLSGLCNCNSTDLGAFFDYLYQHKEEVVFAGTPDRAQLFESYLRIVRHRNFSLQSDFFIQSGSNRVREGSDSIGVYRLL